MVAPGGSFFLPLIIALFPLVVLAAPIHNSHVKRVMVGEDSTSNTLSDGHQLSPSTYPRDVLETSQHGTLGQQNNDPLSVERGPSVSTSDEMSDLRAAVSANTWKFYEQSLQRQKHEQGPSNARVSKPRNRFQPYRQGKNKQRITDMETFERPHQLKDELEDDLGT
ncbi:hypothetical protein FRB95_012906 [Tulasnella sp. JGI-2019a]|nr:hypothetical protein FRB95_012906 [Tulasnella sp. JGI-2019a]